jgi:hypothetical protein
MWAIHPEQNIAWSVPLHRKKSVAKLIHGTVTFCPVLKTRLRKGSCDFDVTTDATTATRSWSMNCAWSPGNKSNTEGVMHFHGDTLDGTQTMRQIFPNFPTKEYSSVMKGRYVGPCDPK